MVNTESSPASDAVYWRTLDISLSGTSWPAVIHSSDWLRLTPSRLRFTVGEAVTIVVVEQELQLEPALDLLKTSMQVCPVTELPVFESPTALWVLTKGAPCTSDCYRAVHTLVEEGLCLKHFLWHNPDELICRIQS